MGSGQNKPSSDIQVAKVDLSLLQRKPMPTPSKCNCSKSKCLKLYCECFAKGDHCTPECNCNNCCNLEGNEDLIEASKADILKRDPDAFRKKLEVNSDKL